MTRAGKMNPFEVGNRKSHTWHIVLEQRIKDDVKKNVEPTENTEYQGNALGLDEKVIVYSINRRKPAPLKFFPFAGHAAHAGNLLRR